MCEYACSVYTLYYGAMAVVHEIWMITQFCSIYHYHISFYRILSYNIENCWKLCVSLRWRTCASLHTKNAFAFEDLCVSVLFITLLNIASLYFVEFIYLFRNFCFFFAFLLDIVVVYLCCWRCSCHCYCCCTFF